MYRKSIAAAFLMLCGLASCSKSNEADLAAEVPARGPCVTEGIRYSTHIVPLLQANCNSCHSSAFPSGGVATDLYAGVKTIADNGKLAGSVSHDGTASPMPLGKPKLAQCDIDKIKAWVREGAKND